ncbi:unnamed protein product [Umbelopsis vinacea]
MLMNPRTYRSRDEVTPRKQQRNRILEIGKPIEFEHGIHVEFNRERGKFMGLPDVWQGVIPSSDDVLDTSCISPHLVPAPYLIAHKTKADNISKPFNVQHNIHVQIDKASYVLQGLPPAWAHQLQSSNQVPAPADFETDHSYASTRTRSSMSPCRSASSASKSFSPLPKSKSWSDIRRKTSKERKKSDACQDPLLLYKDIVEIAEGESGSLYSASLISAPRTTVAIKRINLEDSTNVERKKKEIEIMKQCQHPNTIHYLAHHLTSTELWIVMEYADFCLADIITNEDDFNSSPLDECQIAFILQQLLLALKYIHSLGRIHRDVRADNVLLSSEGLVKLGQCLLRIFLLRFYMSQFIDIVRRIADFGHSVQLTATSPSRNSVVGTPFWMAPEVIKGEDYNTAADIWSLGALLFELLTGSPPYSEYPPLRALFLIASKGLPAPPLTWSDELLDFLDQCTVMEAKDRPTAAMLLEHPFIVHYAGSKKCLMDLIMKPSPVETSQVDVLPAELSPVEVMPATPTTVQTHTSQSSSVWSWMDETNALNMDFQLAIDFDNLHMSSTLET